MGSAMRLIRLASLLSLIVLARCDAGRSSLRELRLSSSVAALVPAAGGPAGSAAPAGAGGAWPTTSVPLSTPALRVAGEAPPRGLFDPSLLAVNGTTLLLALSSVAATDDIATRLAVWDVARGGWSLAARINAAVPNGTLPCAGGAPCAGALVHEVPSLAAAPGGALRVFVHTYAVTGGTTLHYDWGHIALYSAPSPAGPWVGAPLLGWAGASPLSRQGVAQVLTDIPALADCLLFTEPGAAADPAVPGRTLLALGCAAVPAGGAGGATLRIVLLASDDPSARAWAFQGVLVDGATDAARLGYAIPQLNAADLFAAPAPGGGAGLFLAVSPSAQIFPALTGYVGCLVLQVVTDGGAAGVVRNTSGAPLVLRAVMPAAPAFAGACTAAAGAAAAGNGDGYLLPVLNTLGAFFTILPSGTPPI